MSNLRGLLGAITQSHVYIQTHNYPDPDALASARGLQELLHTQGIDSTICFKGHTDKCNTLKMMELLHINIVHGSKLTLKETDEIILVDCQKGNTNVEEYVGHEIACIDHHKEMTMPSGTYRYWDIQSNVGSCSAIIAGYFIENRLPISKELATVLLYGIKMDTANLTRSVSQMDVDYFRLLYSRASKDILAELESSTLTIADLDAYMQTIHNLRVYGTVGFSYVGKNCSEAIIGTLADFVISLTEVSFCMVYSYRAGGLKFSLRSNNPRLDAADIIKNALIGYGDGGGHATMAAGFISSIHTKESSKSIAAAIETRVFHIIQDMPSVN